MKKFYFIHISKTGGTSLRNGFIEALSRNQVLFASTGDRLRLLNETDLSGIKVIGGHIPFWTFSQSHVKNRFDWTAFAVVRDPVDRFLSLYNYLSVSNHPDHSRYKGISLCAFRDLFASRERPDLFMCYYFSRNARFEEARETILREKIAVYPLEKLHRLVTMLNIKLGKNLPERFDNRSRKRISREKLDEIDLSFLDGDRKLYQAAYRGAFPQLGASPMERLQFTGSVVSMWGSTAYARIKRRLSP